MEVASKKEKILDVVFLDIDGVLVPFPGKSDEIDWPRRCLQALDDIIFSTGATIVLSSTWRCNEHARNLIIENFKRFGGTIGHLPRLIYMTDPTKHGA